MRIIESNLSDHILKSVDKELGSIYFFNHIAVIEFKEGVHIDISSSEDFFLELINYFGLSRPFGVITNRINAYSVKLMDIDLFKSRTKNLCAYAVIGHNSAGKMSAEIENSFCVAEQKINFDNLYEAMDAVYNTVKDQIIVTLD
ncbi:hypothetical protein [Changchengzhania lutea]|uniref:hypothetical protein n=1 Tax=Changchengzhania lutea TaxID=2049305 RepID=UPI00115D7BC1|nr:hypothetical protein [Changchengzhania lutea]